MHKNMGVAQLCGIVSRVGDMNGTAVVETVPHRRGTAADAVNFAWNNIIAKQRNDALQWPHPTQAFGRNRRRTPALRFRPWKCPYNRRDRLRQNIRRLTPCLFHDREIHAIAFNQLVLREPCFAQEAFHRLWRRAKLWTFGFFRHRFGRHRQPRGNQRKAARRGECLNRRSRQSGLGERVIKQARQVFLGLDLHPRGNFFGAEFQQEVGHAAHPFFAIHAWQLPLARSRTRPM